MRRGTDWRARTLPCCRASYCSPYCAPSPPFILPSAPDREIEAPAAAKPGIDARIRTILHAENLGAALIATVIRGFLVQVVELLCSSGLPALLTRIPTLRGLDRASYSPAPQRCPDQ